MKTSLVQGLQRGPFTGSWPIIAKPSLKHEGTDSLPLPKKASEVFTEARNVPKRLPRQSTDCATVGYVVEMSILVRTYNTKKCEQNVAEREENDTFLPMRFGLDTETALASEWKNKLLQGIDSKSHGGF